jgi:hydrogenase nickel incorporation protein HypA/HybF
MHELKIAQSLAGIVIEVASRKKLTAVTAVDIAFGQMIQIVPDIFDYAFRECIKDTLAADASLNIEILPLKIKCLECLEEFVPEEFNFRCIKCGSVNLEIIQGKEIFVKSIEGE